MDLTELMALITEHRAELSTAPEPWRRRTVGALASGLSFRRADTPVATVSISRDGSHYHTQIWAGGRWVCDCEAFRFRQQ
jgi:hypothetical protein